MQILFFIISGILSWLLSTFDSPPLHRQTLQHWCHHQEIFIAQSGRHPRTILPETETRVRSRSNGSLATTVLLLFRRDIRSADWRSWNIFHCTEILVVGQISREGAMWLSSSTASSEKEIRGGACWPATTPWLYLQNAHHRRGFGVR